MDVDLSDAGKAQATVLSSVLTGIHFDVMACSSMRRAVQTMNGIFSGGWAHGEGTPHGDPSRIIDPALNERDFGTLEGKEVDASFLMTLDSNDGGGESNRDVARRTYAFLRRNAPSFRRNVLICAHGGSLRMLKAFLIGMNNPATVLSQKFSNAEIAIVMTDRIYRPDWLGET